MKYYDKSYYEFHDDDVADKCFLCSHNTKRLFVVRHVVTEKMVHLCEDCMVENISEYMLDNTKPWTSSTDEKD